MATLRNVTHRTRLAGLLIIALLLLLLILVLLLLVLILLILLILILLILILVLILLILILVLLLILLLLLLLLLLFGGLTIALQDPLFVKWKPTVVNWLFAAAFAVSPYIGGKSIPERLFGA